MTKLERGPLGFGKSDGYGEPETNLGLISLKISWGAQSLTILLIYYCFRKS